MTRGRLAVWPLLVLLVQLGAIGSAGESASEVGFVERFTGEPGDHEIIREGEPVPVAVFAPLRTGDRVAVTATGETLVLRLNDEVLELTNEDPALVLEEGPESATIATNLASWAGEWISGDSGPDTTRVALSARSVDLAAPSWGNGTARLVAGDRALALAWRGGHAPYEIVLARLSPDAAELGRWRIEDAASLRTPRVALKEGAHRLVIRDGQGAELTLALQVVGERPASPLRGDEPLEQTLSAAWLAGRDQDLWRFEAYQQVAALRERYPPAALLCDALERGSAAGSPAPALPATG